ncbi:trafficking protein particle complex subunit 2-like protein [Convolutriloba macropyga]|uniref:trafficking protein particle complex subunit 2-like protein n=1 Tax=Convolutriloba macropyga TaxID=536237 RepID=UPI003F527459
MESSNLSVKDHDMQSVFKKLHNAYSEAVSNPFYNNGDPIKSASFDKVVSSVLVNSSNNPHHLNNYQQQQQSGGIAETNQTAPVNVNNASATIQSTAPAVTAAQP